MVVSDMGEAWSPPTAPDKMAAMHTTSIEELPASISDCKTATAMGISMPKVPQLVPVAKAKPMATRKNMGGNNTITPVLPITTSPT